jgi:hypothetical protein
MAEKLSRAISRATVEGMSRASIWSALVVVGVLAGPASAGVNEIKAVTFEPDASTTRVVVRSTASPTFSVYKLEKPTRVVIDVPTARLAASLLNQDSAEAGD